MENSRLVYQFKRECSEICNDEFDVQKLNDVIYITCSEDDARIIYDKYKNVEYATCNIGYSYNLETWYFTFEII